MRNNHKAEIDNSICEVHRKRPTEEYAGCTCSLLYRVMRKEVQANQTKREKSNAQ